MSPVAAVPYFEITCDDCPIDLSDMGDFMAMKDRWSAEDIWVDHDGFIDGSTALCEHHRPRCLCGAWQEPDDAGAPFFCEDCNEDAEQVTP